MIRESGRWLLLGGAALLAAAGCSTIALAQPQSHATPQGWNYDIQGGKRVPKAGNRVTHPDGSWREEKRQGNCVTVKEMSKSGEYKETRECNPGNPR